MHVRKAMTDSPFVRLISHQPAVLFSQNKPATSNQPAVLFSHSKSAPAISHQPNEQARTIQELILLKNNINHMPLKTQYKHVLNNITSTCCQYILCWWTHYFT
jgi:hypothetical protein